MTDLMLNFVPFVLVAALALWLARARRQPLWAEAFRRLRRKPLALFALGIILLYSLVGLLDSVSWQSGKGGKRETLIDRCFARPVERTYSAPLATMTTGEPIPHRLRGRHLLGTDGVGEDVIYTTLKGARTALIIGGLTTLIVTPLALFFGMLAGYFGRRVDDLIQYL
jgi:peptide/nickel transport system permease protein